MIESERYALLDCEDDTERLIVGNLDLANYMAQRFRSSGAEMDDLIQWARLGLVTAARTYSEDKGIKFSTYACVVMERQIIRGLYINPNAPKRKIKPTLISIESPLNNTEGVFLYDAIPDDQDPIEEVETKICVEQILKPLTDDQRDLLCARFLRGETWQNIGKNRGVSWQAAQQKGAKIMQQIRMRCAV